MLVGLSGTAIYSVTNYKSFKKQEFANQPDAAAREAIAIRLSANRDKIAKVIAENSTTPAPSAKPDDNSTALSPAPDVAAPASQSSAPAPPASNMTSTAKPSGTSLQGLGKPITNSVGMSLVLLPAGEFMMGSPNSEPGHTPFEEPSHLVKITRPFYLAMTEITQGQWQAVMGTTPWHKGNTSRRGLIFRQRIYVGMKRWRSVRD